MEWASQLNAPLDNYLWVNMKAREQGCGRCDVEREWDLGQATPIKYMCDT